MPRIYCKVRISVTSKIIKKILQNKEKFEKMDVNDFVLAVKKEVEFFITVEKN